MYSSGGLAAAPADGCQKRRCVLGWKLDEVDGLAGYSACDRSERLTVNTVAQQRDQLQRIPLLVLVGHERGECRRRAGELGSPAQVPPTGLAIPSVEAEPEVSDPGDRVEGAAELDEQHVQIEQRLVGRCCICCERATARRLSP